MSDQAYICRCGELRDQLSIACENFERERSALILLGQENTTMRAELEAIKAKLCWSCKRMSLTVLTK